MGRGKHGSSSSSSSSDSDSSKKKKEKKRKDKHHRHDKEQIHQSSHAPQFPSSHHHEQPPSYHPPAMPGQQPHVPNFGILNHPKPAQDFKAGPPVPSQAPLSAAPPAAGHRIALSTDTPFPSPATLPPTSLHDLGGPQQPVYVGSAIFDSSVHPCKIAPHLTPPVRVPWGGAEHEHKGRFDLLPIDDQTMEWVTTAYGRIPAGRRPIEGGYEQDGARLFHAIAYIDGIWVPGKTGEHLRAANVPFGGEQAVPANYQILCWRY